MEHWRGLLIAGGIFLLFLLLFCAPVRLYVRYDEGGWTLRGRYLFVPFALYPRPAKKAKDPKKKQKKSQKKASVSRPEPVYRPYKEPPEPANTLPGVQKEPQEQEQPKKPVRREKKPRKKFDGDAFFEKMGRIAAGVRSAAKPVMLFLHRLRVDRICFKGRVAGKDAADTALRFGAVFALWNNLLALFSAVMQVKIAQPDLLPDYEAPEPQLDFSGSFRLSAPLFAALSLLLFGGGRVYLAVNKIENQQETQREAAECAAHSTNL